MLALTLFCCRDEWSADGIGNAEHPRSELDPSFPMSTYRLDKLFSPRSIAVVGASPRERSVGSRGPAEICGMAVSPATFMSSIRATRDRRHSSRQPSHDLPAPPDLVVIAAPPPAVPGVVADAGAKGVARRHHHHRRPWPRSRLAGRGMRAGGARHGLRLVGPNCLGVMVAARQAQCKLCRAHAAAGDLALISQSGAIAAGMVEWAAQRPAGFSAVVSIGDQLDVDFGDLLDYFALDPRTRAILLYIESIKDARKFMSAARAAARAKPVIVIKAGRHAQGAGAAAPTPARWPAPMTSMTPRFDAPGCCA